ncbi:hypothetical protein DFR70_10512 [Nocardia tenerifensis]|uniref:ASCH domain-containing protein n=1 Tax=Nocardia tenerifensis TaxID=228006 RepID=A0A318JYM0_9NOCA|nr:hypothetical protein [Nocardia tenerifensis]PXX63832.1 hypothetical protein DFR70_10512 [Nocardia tenerifensis]
MLIEKQRWAGIQDGSITVLFRRWRHRHATAGKVYRTGAGRIVVEQAEIVAPSRIRAKDAHAAGYGSAAQVLADLRGAEGDPIYLLRIRLADGPDPRAELASDDQLSDEDIASLTARLARMDTSSSFGPWTIRTLRLIEELPATRAPDLAARLGREPDRFKVDVRKLKALGLTSSLEVGYELSPRGRAYLAGH